MLHFLTPRPSQREVVSESSSWLSAIVLAHIQSSLTQFRLLGNVLSSPDACSRCWIMPLANAFERSFTGDEEWVLVGRTAHSSIFSLIGGGAQELRKVPRPGAYQTQYQAQCDWAGATVFPAVVSQYRTEFGKRDWSCSQLGTAGMGC